jgi:hypothetical protein
MTHTKDEALQMCLEYIETDAHERKYVRHAIKQALAAQPVPVQEPVAEIQEDMKGGGYVKWLSEDFFVAGTKLYTTPPAQPAVQEPVAWANPHDLKNFDMKVRTNGGPLHTVALCLCTPPAPAVPDALTSADIQEHIEYVAGWNDCRQAMLEMMK